MEIRSLTQTRFETIFSAFSRAFADYELQLDKAQLQAMLQRRGFNSDLSFGAFEGEELVAFTLNGIGLFNGLPTAYDTGTGTVEEHRGKGLATQIFEYSLPYLRDAGIGQYLLEVLQHNHKAISVYRNLGFEVTREFNYSNQKTVDVTPGTGMKDCYIIREIGIDDPGYCLSDFWDFHPSWQNSFESIRRSCGDFIKLGAFDGDKLLGYGVFEPSSGDITQIAVDKANRRKGIGSRLLTEMLRLNRVDSVKAINSDISCSSITGFLGSCNIAIKGQQFEMVKKF